MIIYLLWDKECPFWERLHCDIWDLFLIWTIFEWYSEYDQECERVDHNTKVLIRKLLKYVIQINVVAIELNLMRL